jgi:hypothetical protein
VAEGKKFLERMLQRLHAALTTGPALNCRPHQSRQRVDLVTVARIDGSAPEALLASLLSAERACKLTPRLKQPAPELGARLKQPAPELGGVGVPPARPGAGETPTPPAGETPTPPRAELTPEEKAALKAFAEQQSSLTKLRNIADDARTFEQDTGAHVLHVGFPLLHLPPGERLGPTRSGATKRILAPIAFVPVSLTVKAGAAPQVVLEAAGPDRVLPNTALLAWIRQQTGVKPPEATDDDGREPWALLSELISHVAKVFEVDAGAVGAGKTLVPAPRAHIRGPGGGAPESGGDNTRAILPAAVLGLYPLSNQALLGDMEDMIEGTVPLVGPIESFLKATLDAAPAASTKDALATTRAISDERLVTDADPCQARAVRLARAARGLVIHGPPGTGKSQTIANIVGDHLARGERVLFVCDKRTALDVVQRRIAHLGLGQLCAVVHDAHKDQRELYRSVRDQVDTIVEAKTNPQAAAELQATDRELEGLHKELLEKERALAERPDGGKLPSFHELAGEWLLREPREKLAPLAASLDVPALAALPPHERAVREVLERGAREGYAENPWREAAGLELGAFLARPLDDWRKETAALAASGRAADGALDARVLPFVPGVDLAAQGTARRRLADELASLATALPEDALARWARATPRDRQSAKEQLGKLAPQLAVLAAGPLDPELAPLHAASPVALSQLALDAIKLRDYAESSKKWWSFLAFGKKGAAAPVALRYGLPLTPENAARALTFVEGVRARGLLAAFQKANVGKPDNLADDVLARTLTDLGALLAALELAGTDPALAPQATAIREAFADPARRASLVEGLRVSDARVRVLALLEEAAGKTALLAQPSKTKLAADGRAGSPVAALTTALDERLGTLEGILRLRVALATLPEKLAQRVQDLARAGATADEAWSVVTRAVLSAEMSRRVRSQPALAAIDADSMRAAFDRVRALEKKKLGLVRDAILGLWLGRMQERLVASTGSRLNSAGAELKRRLMLRGERALKLRPMIAAGAKVEGGDPLFDVRPVWMASPQTVAQIFPRQAIFDVLVVDEASQCRLEEALPLLLRAKRVVIAGDPKQLPPTRFFESAVSQSTDDGDTETEQGLFEEQQSEVEDLLGAALNLEVEQSYLDVHYRSRNADLIDFSNRTFYGARLQPIPGHPSRRSVLPPIRLVLANGVYEKRVNLVEARKVVEVVRELLSRKEPPSLGIACMSLSQKDAIQDALDEAAAQDAAFAAKLAQARAREGAGSFEGLFVKNLENVQGDERDHIIISTTYGPDANGRFYRRFGPLGMAGGGRRLNVLVTRARDEVHLVTSIPAQHYAALAPVEAGRAPNGAWLLFSYLKHASDLAAAYLHESERLQLAQVSKDARALVRDSKSGSKFARALGEGLAQRGVSSAVHWGNEGFCVDVALAHPTRAEDVTIGVLCDTARFERARDKVEWDIFRTAALEAAGWKLHRVWTPQFIRNPEGAVKGVLEQAARTP